MNVAVLAGAISTGIFAVSYLPMVVKAVRTRDLASYSFGNLMITNVGNLVHSVYVFSLPFGPIWFLHGFYLVASALMLGWYLRFVTYSRGRSSRASAILPTSTASAPSSGPAPSSDRLVRSRQA